jgi:hypothetical protein
MLAERGKSIVDGAELWEQQEFGLSNHMAATVVGYFRFLVLGPSSIRELSPVIFYMVETNYKGGGAIV